MDIDAENYEALALDNPKSFNCLLCAGLLYAKLTLGRPILFQDVYEEHYGGHPRTWIYFPPPV